MHKDPTQWQSPEAFIPERFDPSSDYFKKPDGSKRHAWAYGPFLGGSRVCLGKSFADMILKFSMPLYFYYFNFELVKEE